MGSLVFLGKYNFKDKMMLSINSVKPLSGIILTALLLGCAGRAIADGFKADVGIAEAFNNLNILTIDSLAVGEKGLVGLHNLLTCIDSGSYKVVAISRLENDVNPYISYFEITKLPDHKVDASLSPKGKSPDVKTFQAAIINLLESKDCSEYQYYKFPFLDLNKFLGEDSFSALLAGAHAFKNDNNKSEEKSSDEPSVKNNWIVSENKSPIDDSAQVTMLKYSESGDQSLIIRCKENTTDLYINTKNFLGSRSQKIIVRIDDKKAENVQSSNSTDNKSLFITPVLPFIKKIIDAKAMVVRYETYSDGTKTTIINLEGLKDAIVPLRKACKW